MKRAFCECPCRRSATLVALLLTFAVPPAARAYETPAKLNEVARYYSLGVGEVRCASSAEWNGDGHAKTYWAYTNVRLDYTVLAPLICEGALNVATAEVPAWQRAIGTLVLVHEAFHLRHWRFRRNEAKVECQALVYFTEVAQKLGATEAEANTLYPYALAWHWQEIQLLPWYQDRRCLIPPWITPMQGVGPG